MFVIVTAVAVAVITSATVVHVVVVVVVTAVVVIVGCCLLYKTNRNQIISVHNISQKYPHKLYVFPVYSKWLCSGSNTIFKAINLP